MSIQSETARGRKLMSVEKVLKRLSDRTKPPRRWWFPVITPVRCDIADLQKLHTECSDTIRKTSLVLLGFCFFSLVALGASDESLLGLGKEIKLPFADTYISFLAFLYLTPVILLAITVYLHIFVGQSLRYSVMGLKPEKKLLTVFNIDEPLAKFVSAVLLYWLVPIVLVGLTWKALPRPEAPQFVILTCAITGILIVLQIRRCSDKRRRNVLLWLVLAGGITLLFHTILMITVGGELLVSRNLWLFKAQLQNVDLRDFQMHQAYLVEAQLSDANLTRANLSGANLSRAILSRANLSEAKLGSTDLTGADLVGANLIGADLSNARLGAAKLTEARLSFVKLQAADLSGAKLGLADLTGADLLRANLLGADLRRTKLKWAKLREARLWNVNLGGADLEEADLRGATLGLANEVGFTPYPGILCEAAKLEGIKLDHPILTAVREKCPKLFKSDDEGKKADPEGKSRDPAGRSPN